jgi:hypothetical protein
MGNSNTRRFARCIGFVSRGAVTVAAFLGTGRSGFEGNIAHANGRLPAANQIVFSPQRDEDVLLRVTFGVLASRDAGKSWQWTCESAMGYSGVQDPSFAILSDGAWLGGAYEGLVYTADACAFRLSPGGLGPGPVADVTRWNARPAEALVLLSGASTEPPADAAVAYASSLWRTRDAARSFAPLASLDGAILFETVEVAESDPQRVYLTGSRGTGSAREGLLLRSDDGGRNFREIVVPLITEERAPYVSAVDPRNANRVYVRTAGPPSRPGRLLVSDDGGLTFGEALRLTGQMLGFALSPSGDTVFAGSTTDGLFVGDAKTLSFNKVSDVQVQCLAARDARDGTLELWACSNQVSGFVAGRSRDGGRTFVPLLELNGVAGPAACAQGTAGARCIAEWPALRAELGGPSSRADAAATPSTPSERRPAATAGGACDAAGERGLARGARGLWSAGALALVVFAWVARYGRRKRATK